MRRLISEHTDDVAAFFSDLTRRAETLMGQLLGRNMENSVASRWPELLEKALNGILTALPQLVYGMLQKVPRFFISLFVFIVSTYYFSCDWESIHNGLGRVLPPRGQEILSRIRRRFLPTLWRWIKAWGLLFLLSLTQLFLGLLLLRQSGAFSKALLIALYSYTGMYLLLALFTHALTGIEPAAECGVLAGITATESIVAALIKWAEVKEEKKAEGDS